MLVSVLVSGKHCPYCINSLEGTFANDTVLDKTLQNVVSGQDLYCLQ